MEKNENLKLVTLSRNEVTFNKKVSVSYVMSVSVGNLLSITTKIDESEYFLALAQKGKNPVQLAKYQYNANLEFYTGIGKNDRPYYMALVPYATYKDDEGLTHVKKKSIFLTHTNFQLSQLCDNPVKFIKKEIDSITDDEIEVYNPDSE